MSTEFESPSSIPDWSDKLAQLLSAARSAIEQDDDTRLAVARRLTDFIAHSHPATPEIRRLDEIASQAARALAEHVAHDAVERLASRAALLEVLAGELDSIRDLARTRSSASAASVAQLARALSAAADDTWSLASRPASLSPAETRTRIARLASTLADLHAAFLTLSGTRPEPVSDAPGTVLGHAPKGQS